MNTISSGYTQIGFNQNILLLIKCTSTTSYFCVISVKVMTDFYMFYYNIAIS